VPDFNFAKGGGSRDPGKRIPRSPEAPDSPSQGERSSVLDKYPARDLSHLSGETPPPADLPPDAADAAAADSGDEYDAASTTDGGEVSSAGTDAGAPPKKSGGNGPLIAILSIVLLLVIIAFLWHVNPFPSVRNALAGLFTNETEHVVPDANETADAEADQEDAAPPLRSWDYFLQVSSWDDLAKADLDAERYRAQGLDVVVESEYIPRRRRTFYRVRLGPYRDAAEAASVREEFAAVIPSDAFLDSTRLIEDETVADATPPPAPAVAPGRARSSDAPVAVSEFDVVDEPLSGFAVKVSSFTELGTARIEARKLLGLGYPAFITKKRIGATNWYRVLVGPFTDRRDANRYMDLLNVTYGNEAYTIDLAKN
jgi:cell division septation protein DedD